MSPNLLFKQRFVALALVAIFAAIILGCSNQSTFSPEKPYPQSGPIMSEVSWAKGYDDLSSLRAESVVVVEGRVTRLVELIARNTADSPGRAPPPLLMSDFEFQVERVLQGNLAPGPVVVRQTGGIQDGLTMEIRDDPLFRIGDRYILFLAKGPDRFFALGPWGRLIVEDGRAYSLSKVLPERNINDLGIDGIPVDQLATVIASQ